MSRAQRFTICVRLITKCQNMEPGMAAPGSPGTRCGLSIGCMPSSFYQIVMDSHDPHAPARFWSAVLDQPILFEADDEVIVGADKNAYPGMCFVTVPEAKTIKN